MQFVAVTADQEEPGMRFVKFTGNCPKSVKKDAKYAIRRDKASVIYEGNDGEKFYLATAAHTRLVDVVNTIKEGVGGNQRGPFYINEYRQVIVPVGPDAEYYYAGDYTENLEFDFEGGILSGAPVDPQGRPLKPGDIWTGPHAGIRYKLNAGGNDISYTVYLSPISRKDIRLSALIGATNATKVARRFREVKGADGGRLYTNEFRAVFAPVPREDKYEYIYVGQLPED
jgi:hypothetical protein